MNRTMRDIKRLGQLIKYRTGLNIRDAENIACIVIRELPEFIIRNGELTLRKYGKITFKNNNMLIKPSYRHRTYVRKYREFVAKFKKAIDTSK